MPGKLRQLERPRLRDVADLAVADVDHDLPLWLGVDAIKEALDRFDRKLRGQQAVLQRVLAEDIGERGREHGTDAPAGQTPDGVLARGTDSAVLKRDQYGRALKFRPVHHEVRVAPPEPEAAGGVITHARLSLEGRREHLVRVDVGAAHG